MLKSPSILLCVFLGWVFGTPNIPNNPFGIFHSDEIFHWDWMKIMGQGLLLQAWPFGYSICVGVSERWRKAAVQKRERHGNGAPKGCLEKLASQDEKGHTILSNNLHVMPDFMGF
jgi:hypothetical protein